MDSDKATGYLYELVQFLLNKNGFEIFITAGSPPAIKVGQEIVRVNDMKLTPTQSETLVQSIMNDRQLKVFEGHNEANFTLNYPDLARFRVSAFKQRGSAGMVLRLIKGRIPTIEELNLPPLLKDVALAKRGLVVVLGPTGCGKTTSCASMIDYRNENSFEHIVTIEDPIEFYFSHKKCIVDQREIGVDTETYEIALKNTLRQAPNVIFIGEIRDRESLQHAVAFAETGHLCLATLHANSTDHAFERMVNLYPDDRREQLLMDLSFNMLAFIGQRLIPRIDEEGMIPAVEVLLRTPLIAELIFKNRLDEIKPAMAKNTGQGLRTFDQALFELYEAGHISFESALRHADSVNTVRLKIKLESKRPLPESMVGRGDNFEIEVPPEKDKTSQWF